LSCRSIPTRRARNDGVALTDSSGPVTIFASGSPRFGIFPGNTDAAAVVQYTDAVNQIQFAVVPMNGSITLSGAEHYDYAFLTDATGDFTPDYGGSTFITETNSSGQTIASGTIYENINRSATETALVLDQSSDPFMYDGPQYTMKISLTGDLDYAPGLSYGSIVVAYLTAPEAPLNYAVIPFGGSVTLPDGYVGFLATDNTSNVYPAAYSGNITIAETISLPEPASAALLSLGGVALLKRRQRTPIKAS
jgi:hypothetical protein